LRTRWAIEDVPQSTPNTLPGSVVQLLMMVIGPTTGGPEFPKVVKLEGTKTRIVCGEKVTLNVATKNFGRAGGCQPSLARSVSLGGPVPAEGEGSGKAATATASAPITK
jgi:hypothetical protein